MKNESVIEHSRIQEIWNEVRFWIFEGRKNEMENLFYVQILSYQTLYGIY